ncbi:hypothetical protein BOX15_Mlig025103g2 [Macrostomum lignano]|uniref:Uncharacterized protein n=1 Tax=Macrostomum lignano TaxID=282301 RepID=A0A267GLD1_9PLAT|nr:hypothetical protein BOX15_Mlig025103g2 [Macrostomum lignano]
MDCEVVTQVDVHKSRDNFNESESGSSASSVSRDDWLQLEMMLDLSPPRPANGQMRTKTMTRATRSLMTSTKTATAAPVGADRSQGQSSLEQLDISEYMRLLHRLRRRRRLLGLGRGARQQLQRLEAAQRRLRQLLASREADEGEEGWEILEETEGADDSDNSSSVTLLDCSLRNSSSLAAARDSQRQSAMRDPGHDEASLDAVALRLHLPIDKREQKSDEQEQQAGEQQAGEQQAGEQKTGEQQAGEQQAGEQQTGEQQAGEQPTGEQQAGEQQAGEQQTGEQQAGEQQELSTLEIRPSDEPLSAGSNLESTRRLPQLALHLPDPLDDSAKAKQQRARLKQQEHQLTMQHHQQLPPPKAARPLPLLPNPPPPGPKSILALTQLMACRLPEPVISLSFDPVGRRLICAEPSRGICFRSVTFSGDDLAASRRLDWRIWARSACVLPSGHLLVATTCNLQVIRPDGVRLSMSERRFPILAMAVYERIAYIATCKPGNDQKGNYFIQVYELPRLTPWSRHPFSGYHPLSSPTEMCTLSNLAVIAQTDEAVQVIEIDSGRLRQNLQMTYRRGPKHVAACNKLGLLFLSLLAERCIQIYQLRRDVLEKVGNFRDPALLPGPLAWLPVNGILFCACSFVDDARRSEIRTLGLHEADRTNWTPRCIRLMPL